MAKLPLKALFFDIDDTVYSTTEFAQNARRNAVAAMIHAGLKVEAEDCLRELDEVISEFGSNYEHHFDKLMQRLPPGACGAGARIIVVAAGMVAYHQTKFRNFTAYEDAIEVLRVLKEAGLPLGIVTAGVAIKQAEKVVRLGLHKLVCPDNIFITDCLGISKSNAKLYLRACAAMGVEPAEAIYIGDNPKVDVDVPSSVGMRTILSRRSGKYASAQGDREPDHVVHNFWDVQEIIDRHYEITPR